MYHQQVINHLKFDLRSRLVGYYVVVLVNKLRVKLKYVDFALGRISVQKDNFVINDSKQHLVLNRTYFFCLFIRPKVLACHLFIK